MTTGKSQSPRLNFHLPMLDGLRGVAIGWVFLFHALGAAYGQFNFAWNGYLPDLKTSSSFILLSPITFGYTGVAIFFVISGFCIHLSFLSSDSPSWISFFNKRLFRIYPAYLLALAFFFYSPIQMYPITEENRFWQLTTHLFAFHNFQESTYFGINPSFWSIAVEIQLYLLYPALLWLTRKYGWKKSLMALAAIELSIRTTIMISDLFLSRTLPTFWTASPMAYWFSWSLGAFICENWRKSIPNPLENLSFFWLAALSFASAYIRPLSPFTFTLVALSTAVFISSHLKSTKTDLSGLIPPRIAKHLCFLGMVSYSFYLFHQPLVAYSNDLIQKFIPNIFIPSFARFLLMLLWYPVILMGSFFLYKTIEIPFIRIGKTIPPKGTALLLVAGTAKSKAVPDGGYFRRS